MEPTTVGLGAITAYLAKDGVSKLLGPTADYLGEGLSNLTKRRVESIGKMFSNAAKKLGSQIEAPGQVPPRILKTVMDDASYCEDPLVLEYFGGVLASSRTEDGRDDRGARLMKIVDNLSTYQIRTHYLLYSTIASLFSNSGKQFGTTKDRIQLGVFLPFQAYATSMMFSQKEWGNPQILRPYLAWPVFRRTNREMSGFSGLRRPLSKNLPMLQRVELSVSHRQWERNSFYGPLVVGPRRLSICFPERSIRRSTTCPMLCQELLPPGFSVTSDAAACAAFTRVVACVVAEPPLCHRSASDDVVTYTIRSDCYRLERQLPGGIRTR